MALRPDRASSYNNVLTAADGGVANVEGSATDAEVTGLDERGHLVHTNHYVCDRMLPFEGDPEYADALRGPLRARPGSCWPPQPPGSVTMDGLHAMLADHEGAPDSICRHPDGDRTTETAFWCVADVTDGVIAFGRGNPCDSVAQEYRFARLRRPEAQPQRRARGVVARHVGRRSSRRRWPPPDRRRAARSARTRSVQPVRGGAVQRRPPVRLPCVRVRAGARATRPRSRCCEALAALCNAVPVIHPVPAASTSAPRARSRRGHVGPAEERREVQRREAVARARVHRRRIFLEQLGQPVRVAERRRLEDVERARGAQRSARRVRGPCR